MAPRVPTYESQVTAQPVGSAALSVNANADAFGAGQFRQLGQAAQVVNDLGQAYSRRQDAENVMSSVTQLNQWETEVMLDMKSKRGKELDGYSEEVMKRFEKMRREQLSGARSDNARRMLTEHYDKAGVTLRQSTGLYEIQESRRAAEEAADATVTSSVSAGAVATDPAIRKDKFETGLKALNTKVDMAGFGEEVRAAKVQQYTDQFHLTSVQAMIARGEMSKANAYLNGTEGVKGVRDSMSGQAYINALDAMDGIVDKEFGFKTAQSLWVKHKGDAVAVRAEAEKIKDFAKMSATLKALDERVSFYAGEASRARAAENHAEEVKAREEKEAVTQLKAAEWRTFLGENLDMYGMSADELARMSDKQLLAHVSVVDDITASREKAKKRQGDLTEQKQMDDAYTALRSGQSAAEYLDAHGTGLTAGQKNQILSMESKLQSAEEQKIPVAVRKSTMLELHNMLLADIDNGTDNLRTLDLTPHLENMSSSDLGTVMSWRNSMTKAANKQSSEYTAMTRAFRTSKQAIREGVQVADRTVAAKRKGELEMLMTSAILNFRAEKGAYPDVDQVNDLYTDVLSSQYSVLEEGTFNDTVGSVSGADILNLGDSDDSLAVVSSVDGDYAYRLADIDSTVYRSVASQLSKMGREATPEAVIRTMEELAARDGKDSSWAKALDKAKEDY